MLSFHLGWHYQHYNLIISSCDIQLLTMCICSHYDIMDGFKVEFYDTYHVHPLTRPGGELLLEQIMSSQVSHCF